MKKTIWEIRDAANLIGTNARRLQGWAEKELLVPSVAGGGKGSRRLYSFADLCIGVVLLGMQNAMGEQNPLLRHPEIRANVERLATKLQEAPADFGADTVLALVSGGIAMLHDDISATFGSFSKVTEFIKAATDLGAAVTVLPVAKPLIDLVDRCEREVEF